MKYNMQDMAEVTFINKNTGENVAAMSTFSTTGIVLNKNYTPIPRVFRFKNNDVSKDLFEKSLPHVGKTLRLESDITDGLFKLSLEKDEIVFTEVLQGE